MNFMAPNFHFQQGEELCFQTSIPHQQQQQILQDMFIHGPPGAVIDDHQNQSFKLHTVQRRKPVALPPGVAPAAGADVDDDSRSSKKKKIVHRDVERQRRHEMAMLYASLRSLLPLEYLKGKRSISDHMNEAANYIRHQQKKIKELTEKRDGLRRVTLSSSSSSLLHGKGSSTSPCVVVRPCWAGVEVVISSGPCDGAPLPKILTVLVGEGLDVVSCVSTNVEDGLIHTIQCEVGDVREADLCGVEQKLADLIGPGLDSSEK
ncbi:transcription factor bHLH36 [Magnolia sinica]|uniref:transcription factor bHLH36 n=1 Tax=Magnolia sinica TaxID=86752 RepID=UPI00265B27E8|nr:transcription factor bHLH36 [Magnolia sinica]